jgi:hypothetical protein
MRFWLGVVAATVAAVVTAAGAFGGSDGETAAAKPTLAVVVVGSGRVTSKPAGISCPGKCVATFAKSTTVLLTPTAKSGSRFLRWGGSCSGTRACRVKVSALSAVAAQFIGPSTKPAPPQSAVETGGYSGRGFGGLEVTFLVPAGAGSVLDFSSSRGPTVTCAGGGSYSTPFTIPKATIKPDRSFTAKASEGAVVNGANATITYSVTGRFQGTSAAGAPTAAGVYREDIVFTDTPNRKCTSNDQQWSAARTGG